MSTASTLITNPLSDFVCSLSIQQQAWGACFKDRGAKRRENLRFVNLWRLQSSGQTPRGCDLNEKETFVCVKVTKIQGLFVMEISIPRY